MNDTVMLNVRMNRQTKERGCQVLERANMSVSDFVRRAFEHLERTQTIPEFAADADSSAAAIEAKRQMLMGFADCAAEASGAAGAPRAAAAPLGAHEARDMRLDEKYAEYLS